MDNHQDCQSYLSHLQAEHHRLELLSKNIADRFSSASDRNWESLDRPEIAARLSALNDELAKHIDRESEGGCVDEAVSRLPSLSQSAQQLDQENDELTAQLRQVMQIVNAGSRTAAETVFQAFAIELRLHEQREEEVVQKGLNAPFEE